MPTLVETISQTRKLPYMAVSLRTGDDFLVGAKSGSEEVGGNFLIESSLQQGTSITAGLPLTEAH